MNTRFNHTVLVLILILGTFFHSHQSIGQVKIGSNPTTIDPANNLEIEASTPDRKISADKTTGKFTIKDGSEGESKIFTSDANGEGTWKSPSEINVEKVVFIGELASNYVITTFDGTFNSLKDRLPLSARSGSLPGYNATTKQYTIQEDGYYRVFAGANASGSLAPGVANTTWRIYIHPFNALQDFNPMTTSAGPVLSTFWQSYLTAGTTISLYTISLGDNQNIIVKKGFISISKLF